MNFLALMYVAIGGAVGSMGRYALMTLITRANPTDFPYHTLAVNIIGGFVMGLWIGGMASLTPSRANDFHLLVAVGVLGGFTTFSAFSLDVVLLIERGLLIQAAIYILGSVALSVAGLLAGMYLFKLVG